MSLVVRQFNSVNCRRMHKVLIPDNWLPRQHLLRLRGTKIVKFLANHASIALLDLFWFVHFFSVVRVPARGFPHRCFLPEESSIVYLYGIIDKKEKQDFHGIKEEKIFI